MADTHEPLERMIVVADRMLIFSKVDEETGIRTQVAINPYTGDQFDQDGTPLGRVTEECRQRLEKLLGHTTEVKKVLKEDEDVKAAMAADIDAKVAAQLEAQAIANEASEKEAAERAAAWKERGRK